MELRRRPRVSGERSAPPTRERPAATEPDATSASPRKLTFSFDSAGWLYCYHLGAAQVHRTGAAPLNWCASYSVLECESSHTMCAASLHSTCSAS